MISFQLDCLTQQTVRVDYLTQQAASIDCLETFFNGYKGYSSLNNPNGIVELANGNLMIGGFAYPESPGVIQGVGYLTTINKSGTVVSSKNIHYNNEGGVLNLVKMKDGGVLTVSNAGTGTDYSTTFSRYDAQMNLIWEKSFQPVGIMNVTVDDAGNIYFVSLVGQLFIDQRLVYTKLAPDGQIIFRYAVAYNAPSLVYGNYASMCLYNNMLYMAVECADYPVYHTMMICINPVNGVIQWSRLMSSPDLGELDGFDQLFVANNRLYAKVSLIRTINTGTVLIEFNANGDVLNTRKLSGKNLQYTMRFGSSPDGYLIASGSGYDYNTVPANDVSTFVRLNLSLDIVNSRRHIPPASMGCIGIFASSDGYLYEGGRMVSPTSATDFYIRKMAPDGQVGKCPEDTLFLDISSPSITYSNLPLTRSIEPLSVKALTRSDILSRVDSIIQYCGWENPCDTFYLEGGSAICGSSSFIIKAHRSPGCTATTDWLADLQTMTIIHQTDTTLEVQLLKTGATLIRAQQFDGCKLRSDSFTLSVYIEPSKIDLGPDGNLCGTNDVILHAQPNYASYLWEDGTIDSVHLINQPGTYYVSATSFCGITSTDTIVFKPSVAGKIDLGPDRVKCNDDTLSLTAPAGLGSYLWTNSLNSDSMRTAVVIVNPATNCYWFLKASMKGDCPAVDTIHITVLHSSPAYLGKDTSFCQRDSLLLHTTDNYQSYLWSTGAIRTTISITQPGSYWLAATASNGCISRDTITVGSPYPLPIVALDHDPGLCEGATKILSVPQGFSSYNWNDGTTSISLPVSAVGTYWVKVKDFRGCINTDTVVINIIRALPQKFLPPDSSICPYQELRVYSQKSFNSYFWSSGELTRDKFVTHAGIYVLTVLDKYGCIGKDTIVVGLKDCVKGIFFPTAFSPNGDGKNDTYRPRVNGELVSYRLQIYNRFGQLIFTSTDYRKAWDGIIAGKAQDTGGYVWTASWQFSGNPPESKKGLLILTR